MKQQVEEGSMVRLTRWMVKRYMPGCSIYKTRPPMAGKVKRNKGIMETVVSVGDVRVEEGEFQLIKPTHDVPVEPTGINPYVESEVLQQLSIPPKFTWDKKEG